MPQSGEELDFWLTKKEESRTIMQNLMKKYWQWKKSLSSRQNPSGSINWF